MVELIMLSSAARKRKRVLFLTPQYHLPELRGKRDYTGYTDLKGQNLFSISGEIENVIIRHKRAGGQKSVVRGQPIQPEGRRSGV
jgi:hypothetical protein